MVTVANHSGGSGVPNQPTPTIMEKKEEIHRKICSGQVTCAWLVCLYQRSNSKTPSCKVHSQKKPSRLSSVHSVLMEHRHVSWNADNKIIHVTPGRSFLSGARCFFKYYALNIVYLYSMINSTKVYKPKYQFCRVCVNRAPTRLHHWATGRMTQAPTWTILVSGLCTLSLSCHFQ